VTNAPQFSGFEFALFYDPTNITAASYDVKTGTLFPNPLVINPGKELATPGIIHLGVVNLGSNFISGTGVLAHINFQVKGLGISPLVLAAGTAVPSNRAGSADGLHPDWTRLVFQTTPIDVSTSDGYFKNVAGPTKFGPVASFVFFPSAPRAGQTVTFNATASFDPDKPVTQAGTGIKSYFWDFGEGSVSRLGPVVTHTFAPIVGEPFAGNFSILLKVVDNDTGYAGMQTKLVTITPQPDFSINISPGSLILHQRENGSSVISLASLNGFTGIVTLSPSFLAGLSVFINSTSLPLSTGQTAHALLGISTTSLTPPGNYTETVLAESALPNGVRLFHSASITVSVIGPPPPPNQPPIANFTFSPRNPAAGQTVFFDGSRSFDPDGVIANWFWRFGDGHIGFGPFPSNTYFAPGNYIVNLTVTDNGGLTSFISSMVVVHSNPSHDVAISFISAFPRIVVSTQIVFIEVGIENTGTNASTVDVTVFANSTVIGASKGVFVPAGPFPPPFTFVNIAWDTTGFRPGNYTISATVFLANDPTPGDNSLRDGQVKVLPPPTLTLSPSSGALGTKVVVQGAGFPPAMLGPSELLVSFDDMFIGFVFPQNGTFTFTFNVPHAEPGPHSVKAFEPFSRLNAIAPFQVLPSPGTFGITLTVGTIYFPEESAVVYVITTQDGVLVSPSGLQLQLIRPDGSVVILNATSLAPGLFKATFTIPRTAPIGTYAIIARAQASGSSNNSALASFEVKPTWLSSHGSQIVVGATLAGSVALVSVAWWRGYFRRNKESPQPDSAPTLWNFNPLNVIISNLRALRCTEHPNHEREVSR
jgi:PKD repeat protein